VTSPYVVQAHGRGQKGFLRCRSRLWTGIGTAAFGCREWGDPMPGSDGNRRIGPPKAGSVSSVTFFCSSSFHVEGRLAKIGEMMKAGCGRLIWLICCVAVCCGCSQRRGNHIARDGEWQHGAAEYVLASDPSPHASQPVHRRSSVSIGGFASSSDPATQPAAAMTQPERLTYTSPGLAAQRLTLLVMPSALAAPGTVSNAARAFGESSITPSGASLLVGGRTGLAASQPRTLEAVNSIPGLQRGPTAGLGFAARQTVLTAGRNPTAGPCQSLIRAGFFPNQATCKGRFR